MTPKLVASVDRSVCVGNASCIAIAPKVFALDESMQSTVVDSDGDVPDVVLDAAEACPVSAISVVDAATGETLFP